MRTKIVNFYLGKYRHPGSGLMIEDMWKWDDERMESIRGYMSWWFPTKKESGSALLEPIAKGEVEEFKTNQDLRKRMLISFYRILGFYGLEIDKSAKRLVISRAKNYDERKQVWVTPDNHNYKRISRILQSLVLLGFKEAAEIFLAALVQIYYENRDTIGAKAYEFWTLSVTDPQYWNGPN